MNKKDIGLELKKYRMKAGLTQEELANACDLKDKSIIYKYERGDRMPDIERTLPKICKALGITFEILFKEL